MSTERKSIVNILRGWLSQDTEMHAPKGVRADFVLIYEGLKIGILSVVDGRWTFRYLPEFREQSRLRPIVEFPDVDKTYESEYLWPFFSLRIPSLQQPAVEDILEDEGIDGTDEVQLLKRFGQRTIANPFELKIAS